MQGTIAIVILVSPRPASCHFNPALEAMEGVSCIGHLMRRLRAGTRGWCGSCTLAVPAGPNLISAFADDAREAGFSVFPTRGTSPLEILGEYAEAFPDTATLAVYPELAVFPDLEAAFQMIAQHRNAGADASIAPRMPEGLLPVIFEVSAIRRLKELGLPAECGADVFGLMANAGRLLPEEPSLQFSLYYHDAEAASGLDSATLPLHMHLDSRPRREAAARVLASRGSSESFGPVDARRLKAELVRVSESYGTPRSRSPRRSYAPAETATILFCSWVSSFAGAEASWAALITGLDRRKYRPLVLLPCPSELSQVLIEAGVEVEFAEWDFTAMSRQNLHFFGEFLQNHDIRLIDLNGGGGWPILLCARELGVPVTIHIRTYDAVTMQSQLEFCDRIVTVSEALRRDVGRCEIDPKRILAIYNGVDLSLFTPSSSRREEARRRFAIPQDAATVAFIARISREKRFDVFLRAVAEIAPSRPNLVVLCVGEAYAQDQGYASELRELTESLGLADIVRWVGFVRDVASIYAAANVLVVCNPNEALARCSIEACAMGTPVIAPRSGGSVEIVRHGYNGLLVNPEDSGELSGALGLYLDQPDLRRRLSAGALETGARFAIGRHIEAMSCMFDELLARGGYTANQSYSCPISI